VQISIIIPAFNEEKLLGASLAAVQSAARVFNDHGWSVQIIVCNNNSTDRTAEIAREAGADVVFEPVNQIARARNTGASAATGDWLLFVDADSQPSAGLFNAVADQIATGSCLAGGSTVRIDEPLRLATGAARVWNCISRTFRLFAGSFIFCEAEAFRAIGGFTQELFAAEEIDLASRLKRLARQRKMRIVILSEHPLLTSARKAHLYTNLEQARFMWRVLFRRKQTLGSRDACHSWYDGRR
jgi:glycosyltransferase involved in cell wall biosynthesis